MQIKGSVALVTGANRGLGQAYAAALLHAGAAKVYAGARDPAQISDARLVPIKLDIRDPHAVAAAAQQCSDVNLLINNAGIMRQSGFVSASSTDAALDEMMTNYLGTLAMCRAFAPILGKSGGGALVNMLSVVSWFTHPLNASYCASKAAQKSLTDGLRAELRSQGTRVVGVYAGFVDTDMAAGLSVPKSSPEQIARCTLSGIEAGEDEVLADARSREIRQQLAHNAEAFFAELERQWVHLNATHVAPGSTTVGQI